MDYGGHSFANNMFNVQGEVNIKGDISWKSKVKIHMSILFVFGGATLLKSIHSLWCSHLNTTSLALLLASFHIPTEIPNFPFIIMWRYDNKKLCYIGMSAIGLTLIPQTLLHYQWTFITRMKVFASPNYIYGIFFIIEKRDVIW